MSYLNSLRLHFARRFQADISTVSSDPVFSALHAALNGRNTQDQFYRALGRLLARVAAQALR